MHCLVLSESTRVADRRTDRHTELRQLIPRYHSCSRGKNRSTFSVCCLKHIGAGAERSWSGAGQKPGERERWASVKKIGWSGSGAGSESRGAGNGAGIGSHRNRFERWAEILPLTLRSHALLTTPPCVWQTTCQVSLSCTVPVNELFHSDWAYTLLHVCCERASGMRLPM